MLGSAVGAPAILRRPNHADPLPSRADGSTIAGNAQHLSPLRIGD